MCIKNATFVEQNIPQDNRSFEPIVIGGCDNYRRATLRVAQLSLWFTENQLDVIWKS